MPYSPKRRLTELLQEQLESIKKIGETKTELSRNGRSGLFKLIFKLRFTVQSCTTYILGVQGFRIGKRQ
jgi:hypothetical protein